MSETIIKALIAIVYGIILGIVTVPLSKKLASSRTEDPGVLAPLNKAYIKAGAVILGIGASLGLMFTAKDYALLIRNLAFLIPIFALSFVDAYVRKIPNSCLLSIMIGQVVYIIYNCITTKSPDIIPKVVFGFIFGMGVCLIPGILKIPMGAGDIKYSAVIGFTLYLLGYFESMVIMAILIALTYLYLKLTKKGGMKTLLPMGPFLSVGVVISMCVPLGSFIGQSKLF
ncbi:MAG: prepilin peptidase [Eubacterium sp.]|nr:prepilin peptidase [Eubacterium sp.]